MLRTADRPVPLVATFLDSRLRRARAQEGPMRFSLHIRILSLRQRGGIFGFGDHLEQTADFDDILVVDVQPAEKRLQAWARWNSEIPGPLRDYEPSGDPLYDENQTVGEWEASVLLPENSRRFLGENAAVRLRARPRQI